MIVWLAKLSHRLDWDRIDLPQGGAGSFEAVAEAALAKHAQRPEDGAKQEVAVARQRHDDRGYLMEQEVRHVEVRGMCRWVANPNRFTDRMVTDRSAQ